MASTDEVSRRRIGAALGREGILPMLEGDDAEEIAATALERGVDALVVGLEGSADRQQRLVGRLAWIAPGAELLVVSDLPSPRLSRVFLGIGAGGVVEASEVERTLGPTLRAVLSGSLCVPRSTRRRVSTQALSHREKQVLGMIVMGLTNGEIAGKLYLAESTVKSHLSSAFVKLNVRSRREAAALILDPNEGLGSGILTLAGADPIHARLGAADGAGADLGPEER